MGELTVLERLEALGRATHAGEGVLSAEVMERAAGVEARAGHRLRLSADHTVVALAGSTGSGKSSLLNALAGRPLAEVDVLRPTTSEAMAVVRGTEESGPLLDWLGVRRRHNLAEPAVGDGTPVLDGIPALDRTPALDGAEDGLILLDLPDHDSVRTEHRLEAERLVALVDLMVWVVDPQKYADAALHERYLRGLTAHRDVVLVVLNQVDRLTPAELSACHRDLERLLAQDGLAGVPVLDVSARTGDGVDALRAALDEAARRRIASRARLEADVIGTAQQIQQQCGSPTPAARAPRSELVDALAESAGVPRVAEAVRSARALHAHQATGWPPTRWLSRLRADPLRRLHLGAGSGTRSSGAAAAPGPATRHADELIRTSVPRPGPAELARARAAVRAYADAATAGAPDAWVLVGRSRTQVGEQRDLHDALDRAVAGTRVISARRPLWWSVVGTLQWLVLAGMVAGLLWLGVLAALGALRMPVPDPPTWGELPVPTTAAVGGAVLGLLIAGVSRIAAGVGARRQARLATAHLREAVGLVADRLVVAPVEEVLHRLRECRAAADRAAAPPRRARGVGALLSKGSKEGRR
ncbi:MAG TPA: GTPase [Actinotalea sp.]